MENLPRDFKGIWIPREIWLHTELSMNEKVLWAEINSLDRPDTGCTASNEYFQNFFGWPERTLRSYLARLKALGFIQQTEFDGRQRVLRSCLKTSQAIFDRSDRQPIAGLGGSPLPVSKPGPIVSEKSIENIPPIPKGITPPLQKKPLSVERATHVKTTDEEDAKLVKQLGADKAEACYQFLSEWKEATPKHKWKKGDYLSIIRWVISAVDEKQGKKQWKNPSYQTKSKDSKPTSLDSASPEHLFQTLSIFQKTDEK